MAVDNPTTVWLWLAAGLALANALAIATLLAGGPQ